MVNTSWLNVVYKKFAVDVGVSEKKKVFLVEDNAGWHRSKKTTVPEGIEIEFLLPTDLEFNSRSQAAVHSAPPYSPELQPAERLWTLVDEPLVNQYFETIDEIEDILAKRCCVLSAMENEIRSLTDYHWFKHA